MKIDKSFIANIVIGIVLGAVILLGLWTLMQNVKKTNMVFNWAQNIQANIDAQAKAQRAPAPTE